MANTTTAARIPPLQDGDRLTRAEFERRYEAMPHVKKAELIEGVVHRPSPVNFVNHGEPHAGIIFWLGSYRAHTPGVRLGDNSTVRLDMDNEPQPDVLMMIEQERGGRGVIDADGYIEGGPELVAEVAASSASIDLHAKFRAYRRNRVQEYLVWRVLDEAIDWFVLRRGRYVLLKPDAAGVVRSTAFPGLWLDPAAMLRSDFPTLLAVLHQGMASVEYQAFRTRLEHSAP